MSTHDTRYRSEEISTGGGGLYIASAPGHYQFLKPVNGARFTGCKNIIWDEGSTASTD